MKDLKKISILPINLDNDAKLINKKKSYFYKKKKHGYLALLAKNGSDL